MYVPFKRHPETPFFFSHIRGLYSVEDGKDKKSVSVPKLHNGPELDQTPFRGCEILRDNDDCKTRIFYNFNDSMRKRFACYDLHIVLEGCK